MRKFYRVVAELDQSGHFRFTKTNAYSGNNGAGRQSRNDRNFTHLQL